MSKKDLDQKDEHIKNIHCTKSYLECKDVEPVNWNLADIDEDSFVVQIGK